MFAIVPEVFIRAGPETHALAPLFIIPPDSFHGLAIAGPFQVLFRLQLRRLDRPLRPAKRVRPRLARHRPKDGTLGAGAGLLVAKYDGPPQAPQSTLRWGDDDDRVNDYSDGVSLWDLFRRLF